MDIEQKVDNISRTLINVQQALSELNDNVNNLTTLRNAVLSNIEMDNLTMEVVLGVSDSTLYRWRITDCIPYHTRKNGKIYYNFEEVLAALRKGDLYTRGLNQLQAIENLMKYRDDIIQSKGRGALFVTNKL